MATIYMDPEFGLDSLDGRTVVKVDGCSISGTTVTLPSPASTYGIIAGMVVLSADMKNSGGTVSLGTTTAVVSGSTVTLSQAGTTSASTTLVFSSAIKSFAGVGAKLTGSSSLRIKKSPDPVSLEQTSQWDLLSRTITLPTQLNYNINNCDDFWAAGGTVSGEYYSQVSYTATATTSATVNKWSVVKDTGSVAEGSNSISLVWRTSSAGGAFTSATNGTYTVFYYDLGESPIDLSSYQQISMWARNDFGTASGTAGSGTVKLCLCSDRQGTVVEQSFTIPNRAWAPIVFDNAAGLTSQLRSISIRIENRTGPVTPGNNVYPMIRMDNIIACKARGTRDELTHQTLIGKNVSGEHWWAIRNISGSTIHLDGGVGIGLPSVVRGYYNMSGTSEPATVYKREPFAVLNYPGNPSGVVVPMSMGTGTVSAAGTPDSPTTYSGGWSTDDMSEQSGYSFFCNNLDASSITASGAYSLFEKMGIYRSNNGSANQGFLLVGADSTRLVDIYSGCANRGVVTAPGVRNTHLLRVMSNGPYVDHLYLRALGFGTKVNKCSFVGSETGTGIFHETLSTYANGGGTGRESHDRLLVTNSDLSNNLGAGVYFAHSPQNGSTISKTRILDIPNNGYAAVRACRGLVKIRDCLVPSANPVEFRTNSGTKVQVHNFNGVPGDHRTYLDGIALFRSELGADRRTSTGLGWSLRPLSDTLASSQVPVRAPIAQVFVEEGKTVTASVYMKRDSVNLTAALSVRAGQLAGMLSDVTSYVTETADTWQLVSVSFVAPQSGVVEFEVMAFGGNSYAVFVDDFTLTQSV